MKTILVIRSSAMGDVAMTAPVLSALAKRYAGQIRVVMLTREFYEPFFDGIPDLEIFNIDLAEQHNGVRGIYRLFCQLQKAYKFDLVIDLNYKLYSRLLRRFFNLAGIKTYRIDKGRKEKRMITNKKNKLLVQLKSSIERYVDVFRAAGFPLEVENKLPARPERPIPHFAGSKNEHWIGIAPFAKHKGKVLPIETIRQVIERLTQWDPEVKIFIFGGGRAEKMVARSLVAWYTNCRSTIGELTLRGEMDLIANLDLMLSMDSSAMHMSSLVGVDVISVWGATHPYAGFLGIGQSIENVIQIDTLACRPCSVYGHKPCYRGDYACLNQISPQVIFERIVRCLDHKV
ncbi:MAG: glycosyltransferase family 9 protein [Mucinivorans sp.]